MAHPEHSLQVKINQWVRENVPHPHFFCGIDRTRKQSPLQHIREKARGLVAGTPDTILVVPTLPLLAVELKAPGGKPTEAQMQVGDAIQASGHRWGWCNSVYGYARLIREWGVLVTPYALLRAEHHDAVLAGAAIRREETKTGRLSKKRPSRPRAQKPTAAALAAAHRANDLWRR